MFTAEYAEIAEINLHIYIYYSACSAISAVNSSSGSLLLLISRRAAVTVASSFGRPRKTH
jgi:hypothetical protein